MLKGWLVSKLFTERSPFKAEGILEVARWKRMECRDYHPDVLEGKEGVCSSGEGSPLVPPRGSTPSKKPPPNRNVRPRGMIYGVHLEPCHFPKYIPNRQDRPHCSYQTWDAIICSRGSASANNHPWPVHH